VRERERERESERERARERERERERARERAHGCKHHRQKKGNNLMCELKELVTVGLPIRTATYKNRHE
jgi:hypothetical protein